MILQKSFQYGAQETFYYYYIFVDAYIETDTFNKIQWKKKHLKKKLFVTLITVNFDKFNESLLNKIMNLFWKNKL